MYASSLGRVYPELVEGGCPASACLPVGRNLFDQSSLLGMEGAFPLASAGRRTHRFSMNLLERGARRGKDG